MHTRGGGGINGLKIALGSEFRGDNDIYGRHSITEVMRACS